MHITHCTEHCDRVTEKLIIILHIIFEVLLLPQPMASELHQIKYCLSNICLHLHRLKTASLSQST